MRIKDIKIHNFRSIKDLSLNCGSMAVFLGPNNHGKSNILLALEFALSTSSKPAERDFFYKREENDNEIWVEITFDQLTEQEVNTFKRYILSDRSIRIRKTARLENNIVENAYNGWVEEPKEEWLRSENASNYTTRDAVNKTPLKGFVAESVRLSKANIEEAQAQYIKANEDSITLATALETTPLLGQKNVGGGVLPEFFLIPAVRDLTDEVKIKNTTTFGRLLNRAVQEMAERDRRFLDAQKQLQTVLASLNQRDSERGETNELAKLEESIEKELESWGVKVEIEVTPPEVEKLFELGTDVHLNDGVRTPADRKGHGLQRAMMFALLRSWARALRSERQTTAEGEVSARKQSDSIIFAMEEPELFLHPHAQRRLSLILREISETPQHQVFLCTHSTHFVNLENYREISIITKDNPEFGSQVRQCTTELFEGEDLAERKKRFHMSKWINPDRGKMFFAKHVVFVEGETEKVLLPFLSQLLDIYDPEVSIVDCGSKYNLPLYIAIARAFSIPYTVIHDEDPLPDPMPEEWDEDKRREKRKTFALNESINQLVEAPLGSVFMASPDFEKVAGVSRSQGEKKGKALAALEHYQGAEKAAIPHELKSLVAAAYTSADAP